MIEQAIHAYTKAVEDKFEVIQRPHLCDLVKQLEEGPEFSALLQATRSKFHRDGWHSGRDESWWRDPVHNFFCRTGYYTNTFFKGTGTPRNLVTRYEKAFQRRFAHTTYLAPMEFAQFPKPELKFPGFEIRRFERKELDRLLGNEVNRFFYPYAVVDTAVLQEYWFIVVKAEREVRRLGYLYYSAADVAAAEGRVLLKYTGFPPEIERALERLVLYDWIGDPQDPLTYHDRNGYRFGFNIPFVLLVDHNDLGRPSIAPDCSKLMTTPCGDEGEYEIPIVFFNLNDTRVARFLECIQHADECLGHLKLETNDTHWPFLKVAIDNLIKAFFTDGLEQLLWHIKALEVLLGEPGPGLTASLARRSAAILSKTEKERKECQKKFRELYDLRSAFVHGRQFKEEVHRKQLLEARMMVLRVSIWFVHHLGEIAARIKEESWQAKVPKRKDFLNLLDLSNADCIRLDLSNADRIRLSALFSHFSTGLPEDFLSLSDLSGADRNRLKVLLSNLPTGFPCDSTWSP